MPWKRRGSYHYFYASRRKGGRVAQEYVGRGAAAEMIAGLIARERLERALARDTREKDQRPYTELDDAIERASGAVTGAVASTLEAIGFRQHHRGEWRRRRARA